MTKIYLFIKHILQVIALILIYSCFEQHLTMKLNLVLFLHFFCWDFGIRYCLYFKGDICKYLLVFKHIWFLQMFVFLRFHHQVLFVFERRDLCDSHNGERPFSNTHRLSLQWFSILYYVFCNLYFVYYDLQPILTHTDYHSSNLVFCISELLLCGKCM